MRYFLTGRQPRTRAILLVESGSRGILERLIPGLRAILGQRRAHRPGDLLRDASAGLSGGGTPLPGDRLPRAGGPPQALSGIAAERIQPRGHRLLGGADDDQMEVGAGRCASPPRFSSSTKTATISGWTARHLRRDAGVCTFALGAGGRGRGANPGARVFVSVHVCCICYSMQRRCTPAGRLRRS